MGKPVTLDSDDVEILLNAAAATRHVENALEAVRQDPAMIRLFKSGKIGQALDRCNRARAQAIKEEFTGPPPDWRPTDFEMVLMRRLVGIGVDTDAKPLEYVDLRRYGLVVMGQKNAYVNWGDKTQEMIGSEAGQCAKLTDLGKQFLNRYHFKNQPAGQRRLTHD